MLERPKRSVCKPTQVRRFRKRDRDERGVASTVGTIMALLVFLTFLTLFTNSYIPVWMLDNERNHMNTVINQFGEMKGKIDILSLNAANSNGMTEITMYQTIDLGADGIPVFASPTAGLLSYQPYSSGNNNTEVEFDYHLVAGGKQYHYDQIGGGMVQFYAPNRYYAQQIVTYENGAIVIRQDDGQIVKAYPSLELSKPSVSSPWVNLSFVQVDFVGKTSNQAGTSNVGLNIDLIYLDAQTYLNGNYSGDDDAKMPIIITFKTSNYQAWYSYLLQYLTTPDNNLVNNSDYVLLSNAGTYTVTLTVLNAYSFTFSKAITQISSEVA
jgi:hypothetical protein